MGHTVKPSIVLWNFCMSVLSYDIKPISYCGLWSKLFENHTQICYLKNISLQLLITNLTFKEYAATRWRSFATTTWSYPGVINLSRATDHFSKLWGWWNLFWIMFVNTWNTMTRIQKKTNLTQVWLSELKKQNKFVV